MKLTTITAMKDYPVPAALRDRLVQVGPKVDGSIDVYLDGVEVGTLLYERSSPTVPRGMKRTAISRWRWNGRIFYTRTEAAWAAAGANL